MQLGRLLRTAFLADYFVKTPFRQELQMQAVVNRLANRHQVIEADIMAKIAPTRLSGINLRVVFRFRVERYAADLMPSLAPSISTAVG